MEHCHIAVYGQCSYKYNVIEVPLNQMAWKAMVVEHALKEVQ